MVALSLKVPAEINGGVVPCMVTREQESKASYPILSTLLGMVTELREEQDWKAPSSMLVTLLGMVMEVRE